VPKVCCRKRMTEKKQGKGKIYFWAYI